MTAEPRSVLPLQLTAKLTSLGERLRQGPDDSELAEVLAGLAALPPRQIVPASRETMDAARLWTQTPSGFLFRQLFHSPSPERDLLSRNADYGWLFLFHYNGHVREAALDAITAPPRSPFFFAALAWRLNDWVEPVRRAARRCAERVLPLMDAEIAAGAALYLIDRRLAWGRWRDEPEVLDAVFGRRDVISALAIQLRNRPTGPLATGLRFALRYPHIDKHLPDLALHAVQPPVRAIAYQCLISRKAAWPVGYEWAWIDKVYGLRRRIPKLDWRPVESELPIPDLIRQGANDKASIVRSVAAQAMIDMRAQLPDLGGLVERLAKDRSSAVRSRANFMLQATRPP